MNILIINYYWPPSGGSVVQRWLSFCRFLPEYGITPIVLTVDDKKATYPSIDKSLLSDIPKDLKVCKTDTAELFWLYKGTIGKGNVPAAAFANESNPTFLQKAARFVRGNFFIPDPRNGWNKFALPKAKELIESNNIQAIVTAGPPHSTHLIGLKIKKHFPDIKWIADFHDVWTDVIYYDKFYHTNWAKKKDAGFEKEVLETADRVLTVGRGYKEKLLSKSKLINPDKIEIITMGYDERCFTYESHPPRDEFVITYTGTIADYYHPEVFLEALKEVKEKNNDVKFKLRFVGILSDGIKSKIHEMGLSDILNDVGYVSHDDSIKYLMDSTVLLLINPVVSNEDMVIPGKVYEYLAARKPIINITKKSSDLAWIVSEADAGETFERSMKPELAAFLHKLTAKWRANKNLDLPAGNKDYQKFSRHTEAKELSEIIRSL
ncbi:MAG: glycosyltransferase [Ignavibacteria bacterium]|nr:glycosyltransferase [Ignavibacteria bacterium]